MSETPVGQLYRAIVNPTARVLQYVLVVLLLFYVMIPLSWLFLTAVSSHPGPYIRIPHSVTLKYLIGIITNHPAKSGGGYAMHPIYLTRWIRNSLVLAASATLVDLVCASMAAYALSRSSMKGKGILMTLLLLAGFMPTTAKMLPLFRLCIQLGIVNHLAAVGVVAASGTVGMQTWIMKGFLDNIPLELEEQSWVYGYSRIRSLFRIVLPAAGPGLAVVAFLSFMNAWGAFTVPLILIRSDQFFPISVGISSVLVASAGEIGLNVDYGSICALGVIYAVPSMAIYYVFRKHLMSIQLTRMEVR